MSTPNYNTKLFSSPPQASPKGTMYTESARAKLRALHSAGKSKAEIVNLSQLPKSLVHRILNAASTHSASRKGKKYKPKLLTGRAIRQILRWILKDYSGRRKTMYNLKSQLGIGVSGETIRRTLKSLGYRRYIACPRAFIGKVVASKRLLFAKKYRQWGTLDAAAEKASDQRKVVWSNELIFKIGKTNWQWVTRQSHER